jgi:DNA N-6-adenine-methyltransferase (Dam)
MQESAIHQQRARHPRVTGGTKNDDIETSSVLFDALHALFDFTYDPCPLGGLTNKDVPDGLESGAWGTTTFVNPPYSELGAWLETAVYNMNAYGTRSVFLIPAHTGTLYWDEWVSQWAHEVWIAVTGVRFEGYQAKLSMPMAIVLYGAFADRLPQPRRTGQRVVLGENIWRVLLLPRGVAAAVVNSGTGCDCRVQGVQ